MPQNLSLSSKTTTLVVVEPDPFSLVAFFQDKVFLEQVIDDVLLMPIEPAGEHQEEQLKRLIGGFHGQEKLRVNGK